MDIRGLLATLGYSVPEDKHYKHIAQWRAWYRGHVSTFHRYSIYTGFRRVSRERTSLNMAKQGCEYWADLLWNSDCTVNVDTGDDKLSAELSRLDFTRRFNAATDRAFGLGTAACVVYLRDGQPYLDFIDAEYVYPLEWDGDDIVSCAFGAIQTRKTGQVLYLMIHERRPGGGYQISNRFYAVNDAGETGEALPTPDDVEAEYTTPTKRFAIIRPGTASNTGEDSPLGVSIYANCIDTLKSCDLAYDGIKVSMELGRPRIGVTSNLVKLDVNGEEVARFDPNDISVYDLGSGDDGTLAIKDMTPTYRATEFEASLQTQLLIYSRAIGLGENTFRWDRAAGDVAKTATEIISGDAVLMRRMEKHQGALRGAITDIARALLDMLGLDTRQDITVTFDDSVARDKTAEAAEAWQWVVAGRYPFWRFLVDYKGFDLKRAKEIEAETQADVAAQDPFGGEE